MKAVLVEEAPDEGALCCLCGYPLHGLPFYTTEPQIFDVHLRCAESYCFFIQGHGHGHGQEKSSSPAPANHHYKHDKQLAGRFQYPWQPPQRNMYGNVLYHAQPPSFYHHPYYQPSPQNPCPNVYGNVLNHPQPPPFYHLPHYQQPPNIPFLPLPAAYGSTSINQQAAGNNQVWRPTKWGTSTAAVMIGSKTIPRRLRLV
ncbi:uncharacterized protein LOC122043489 [Zingiber officinale]|uniref:uncharacterized protein LOC122043489 n=1 Tax=Zingiber officinale TaxID=94328 RepID=UPI001C4AA714|nr:uncharacterized protein LOC122043489 [Zingiber officinale]